MGVHQNIYIGPYIKVEEKTIEKEVSDKIMTCSNTDCDIHGKKSVGKFCSNCGSENKPFTIKQIKNIKMSLYNDILYQLDDNEICFEVDNKFLLPNRINDYSIHISRDSNFDEKEIKYISNQIEDFERDHESVISFLREKSIDFKVKFGTVIYWM